MGSNADLATLREQCVALRELLELASPDYVAARQPVDPAPGTPAALALLWAVLGTVSRGELGFVPPVAIDAHEAVLEAVRTLFRGDDASMDRIVAQLPARARLIELGDESVSFSDETSGCADPPVLVIAGPSTDGPGEIQRLDVSCVLFMARHLAGHLFQAPFEAVVGLPSRPSWGEAIPRLVPGALRVDDAWLIPAYEGATTYRIHARSVASVSALFEALVLNRVDEWRVLVPRARESRRGLLPIALRVLARGPFADRNLYTAVIDGVPVLVTAPTTNNPDDQVEILFDVEHSASLAAYLARAARRT